MVENRSGALITHLLAGAVGAAIVLGANVLLQPPATAPNPNEFGNHVRDYLKTNPDAVIDALKQFQANEQKKQLETTKQTILQVKAELYNSPGSPVIGNPNGDVTLVEFYDYNCHYCRGAEPDVLKLQAEDPKLRIVHKQLPILGPSSVEATKVALAVYMQKPAAYEAITKTFMAHDGALTSADIEKAARDTGVDWNRVLVDKESDAVKNEIKANYDLAMKLGLSGTPGFVVGDNFMAGVQTEAQLKDAVAAARAAGWKADAPPAKLGGDTSATPKTVAPAGAPTAAAPILAPSLNADDKNTVPDQSSVTPSPGNSAVLANPTPQDAAKVQNDKTPAAPAPAK